MNSAYMPGTLGARPAPFSQAPSRRRRRFSDRLLHSFHVLFIGVAVALGCMACLVGISWVRSQAAVRVVETQMADIRGGKVEEAYALFSTAYQSGVTLPMFRRYLRRQERLDKVQKLEFWGRSVWGQTAVLWGTFQDDLGHSYPVRYLLIRENGAWRIDNFHISAESPDPYPNAVRFIQI